MVFEVLKRSMAGLSLAGIVTFVALTILTVQSIEVSVADIWLNMLGSMLFGIYFGIASLIYDLDGWSPLKQTVVHFILSVLICLPIAVIVGWVPAEMPALLLGLSVFVITYALFWCGTTIYFKNLAASMNQDVKR